MKKLRNFDVGYLSINEAALQIGVSVRRIQQMCKNGEIPGAVKRGHSWMIPTDEEIDMPETKRKPLPIGISDFKMAVEFWKCGESYTSYQGKYPVIFLSFKDVKCSSWEDTFKQIKELMRSLL